MDAPEQEAGETEEATNLEVAESQGSFSESEVEEEEGSDPDWEAPGGPIAEVASGGLWHSTCERRTPTHLADHYCSTAAPTCICCTENVDVCHVYFDDFDDKQSL